jgi:hypothetical protein
MIIINITIINNNNNINNNNINNNNINNITSHPDKRLRVRVIWGICKT